jgi:hypothetical protein
LAASVRTLHSRFFKCACATSPTTPLHLSLYAGHILSVRVLAGRDYGFVNFDKVINNGFLFAVFAFFDLFFSFS